jgi:hypothetical protein
VGYALERAQMYHMQLRIKKLVMSLRHLILHCHAIRIGEVARRIISKPILPSLMLITRTLLALINFVWDGRIIVVKQQFHECSR